MLYVPSARHQKNMAKLFQLGQLSLPIYISSVLYFIIITWL